MFLEPSSQYTNKLQQAKDIPERFQPFLIEGSNRRCLLSPMIQILSQQIVHPEFELYVHHVFSKNIIELFGKTKGRKWLWFMQHRGVARANLFNSALLDVKSGDHFFMQMQEAKENRFSLGKGDSSIIIIVLKPAGDKMTKLFYPDLWRRLQKEHDVTLHSSTYIEHYYREGLLRPDIPVVLLNAFLSERLRLLLFLFNQQLIETFPLHGLSAIAQKKVSLAKLLLDQSPAGAWTLRELARRTGWNTQDLKIGFKQAYQIPPIQYLRNVRLQLGIMLVRSTTKTIREISRTCGFKRSHHFIRVFKKFAGKTPGELRKEK